MKPARQAHRVRLTAALSAQLRTLGRGVAALPALFAALRKLMFDMTAVALPVVAVAFFIFFLTDDAIVIEAPSVPQMVQNRGVTPELLTQMLQARVQQVYAETRSDRDAPAPAAAAPLPIDALGAAPEMAKTLEQVIDQILLSAGAEGPSANAVNPVTAESQRAFAGAVGDSDASPAASGRTWVPDEELRKKLRAQISDTFYSAIGTESPAEMVGAADDPLVVETAGLHLSLDSLAHLVRRLLGIQTQRRLTMSVLCGTARCDDGALTLQIVAAVDRQVALNTAELRVDALEPAVEAAAVHLLRHFDPQVLATHQYRRGELGEARRLALRAMEDDPSRVGWAYNLLALIEMQDDRWAEAERYLDRVLGADGKYPPALVSVGLLKLQTGKTAEAQRYFERALQIDADSVPAHVNLAVVHYRKGDFVAAKKRLDRALLIDPKSAAAHGNLGNVLLRLCDWQGAARAYEQALAYDPQSAVALTGHRLLSMLPLVSNFRLGALAEPLTAPPADPLAKPLGVAPAVPISGQSREGAVSLAEILELSSYCRGAVDKLQSPQLVSDEVVPLGEPSAAN